MSCARFFPGMYHSFLEGKIEIPTQEDQDNLSKLDIAKKYPHYTLFMTIHIGQAFSDAHIYSNVTAIAKINKDELSSLIMGSIEDNKVPFFDISFFELSHKYDIEVRGDCIWD